MIRAISQRTGLTIAQVLDLDPVDLELDYAVEAAFRLRISMQQQAATAKKGGMVFPAYVVGSLDSW